MHNSSPYNDINEDTFDVNHSHRNNFSNDVQLRRSNVDSSTNPILHRALSTVSANQTLVNNQRNVLANNFRRTSINDEIVTIDHHDAEASFILPNLYELPEDIRNRVMDSLVDTPTMVSLEETKRLNWWVDKKLPCPKLYPLVTTGDGNCLLHATSLAMWGFHDHSLSMRKALNETLITSKPNNSLYRRWRWALSVQNKKYGLVFSEQEWNEEWKSLLRLSSAEPRILSTKSSDSNPPIDDTHSTKSSETNTSGATKSPRQYYESLEEFHVYVLANNIRRPIVIYSDTILRTNDGEAISPIEFGGIYLPLEIPPDKCHKQPVFLAFDAAHFSALVPMEQNIKSVLKATYRIPLIDIETLDLLPIHFFIDPGLNFQWPIDEELSDDKIHLYPNYEESRMDVLEKYLNLSKEYSLVTNLNPSLTTTISIPDESPSTTDNLNNTLDTSTEISSTTATATTNKKLSRSSFHSFSKIIRRTFIHPFSSAKRASLKHQRQHASDVSVISETQSERRKSSPLLNRHTNILTIIVTNFQPKQPKTSDNMIKNYIDACMNEYYQERNQKQMNNENDHNGSLVNLNGNHISSKTISQSSNRSDTPLSNSPLVVYHRHYPSSTTNRYCQELISTDINETSNGTEARQKLSPIPLNSSNKTTGLIRPGQRNSNIDKHEDIPLMDNRQFSTNISYVQPTQRKSNSSIESNNLQIMNNQHHHLESHVNGVSNKSYPSQKSISSSLKRQQSSSSDKNPNHQNFIDSIPLAINISKRTQQQLNPSSNNNIQQKRL